MYIQIYKKLVVKCDTIPGTRYLSAGMYRHADMILPGWYQVPGTGILTGRSHRYLAERSTLPSMILDAFTGTGNLYVQVLIVRKIHSQANTGIPSMHKI